VKNIGTVFVYGTLKIGGTFSYYFDKLRLESENGYIKGELYNINAFPALILPGNDKVHGEIHKYSHFNIVLKLMDQIEGYCEKCKSGNLYERKITKATADNGKSVDVIVYALADSKLLDVIKDGNHFERIKNGSWDR
jgi:gamma-glutamylcyclotransferase (GGCT)/AIG2-like uncharacterized protein YtfP